MAKDDFEPVVDYTTVLDVFEGPLDLLLHLINIAEIRIEDVFVSQVTEQFLDYIEYLKNNGGADLDKVSSYLAIASQIIYIKSKSFAPCVEAEEEAVDEDKEAFIESLRRRELELIKDEEDKLRELETVGYVFREPDESLGEERIIYSDMTVNALLEAFARAMIKSEARARDKRAVKFIPTDDFSVPQKINYIEKRVKETGEVAFEDLFETYSKSEVIVTFEALLEILKLQYVTAEQSDRYDTITIKLNPDYKDEDFRNGRFDEYD